MGLKLQTFINSQGYKVEEGYFELTNVNYNLEINLVTFTGKIYLTKEHKEGGFRPIDTFDDSFESPTLPEDIIKASYDHIKLMAELARTTGDPKYRGFIDCEEV